MLKWGSALLFIFFALFTVVPQIANIFVRQALSAADLGLPCRVCMA